MRTGTKIENVLIYEQSNVFYRKIPSFKKAWNIQPADNYLEFKLKDGNELSGKGSYGDTSTEYIRLQFQTFKNYLT
jgi:hypothetical protein